MSEARMKIADTIIKEYGEKRSGNRDQIEDEVRRIANPLGTNDHESDSSYASEDEMFDTTVREARVTAINGIMGSMFPPSNKWFSNKFVKIDETQDEQRHRDALEKVGDLQFRQLGQDNFYIAMAEALADYLDFGTTNIRLRKGKRRFAHFQAVTKSKYKFQLDDEGFPDIVWVYHKLTAYELKTMFGEKGLTQKVKDAIDEEKYDEQFEVIHKIKRRSDFNPKNKGIRTPDPEKREYASWWVCKDDKDLLGNATIPRRKVIYEDGVYFNEYTIYRLMSRAGQSEGEGLTTMMLPAIRTANSKAKNIEMAENLKVNPPWYEDESNPLGDDARLPGGTVNVDGFSSESQVGPVDLRGIDIDHEKMGLAEIRQTIKTAFFNDAFKMFTNQDVATNRKTAFESRLIKSEQQSLITTIVYGLVEEGVKPLLGKHLDMMIQEGKVPQSIIDDLPENYEIELTSQFAKSIDATRAQDLMTFIEFGLQADQIVPGTTKATVKLPSALRKVALDLEIDVEDIYTAEESDEIFQKELDMQRQMQESQIAAQAAGALGDLTG